LPPSLIHYVDTVARHAYQGDRCGAGGLQQAGESDNALFEITWRPRSGRRCTGSTAA